MSLARALQRLESQTLSNQNLQSNLRTAKVTSENARQERLVKSLSAFSTKLSEEITAGAQDRIKKEMAEARALALEQDLEKIENDGIDPISPEDRIDFETKKSILQENDHIAKAGAVQVLDMGGTFEDSQKVANLSGWALYAFTSQKAQVAGANYQAWLTGEMLNNDTLRVLVDGKPVTPATAQTISEKQACMKALRQQFLIENDLIGIKRELLGEKGGFYEQATEAHTNLLGEYRKHEAIKQSLKIRSDAIKQFQSDGNFQNLYNELYRTVDGDGNRLNPSQVHDEVIKIIKTQMKIDKFNIEELDKFGDQPTTFRDPKDPKRFLTYKEKWPIRFALLGIALDEADADNYRNAETKRDNKGKRLEEAALKKIQAEIMDIPLEKRNSYIADMIADIQGEVPGYKAEILQSYLDNSAPNATDLIRQEGEIKDLIFAKQLDNEELKRFDPSLQVKYKEQAAHITALKGQSKEGDINYLNTMVQKSAGISKIDVGHQSIPIMQQYLQSMYLDELEKAMAADIPNPSQYARDAVEKWFKEHESELKTEEGFNLEMIGLKHSNENLKKIEKQIAIENARITKVLTEFKDNPAEIFKEENIGRLISKEEIINSFNNYRTNDKWTFPGEILRLHDIYPDYTRTELMNMALKAHGLPELSKSAAALKVEEHIPLSNLKVLSDGELESTSRILADLARKTDFNWELVPNGYGTLLESFSNQNEIEPADVAATYDLILRNHSLQSKLGIKPEMLNAATLGTQSDATWQIMANGIKKINQQASYMTQLVGIDPAELFENEDFFFNKETWREFNSSAYKYSGDSQYLNFLIRE